MEKFLRQNWQAAFARKLEINMANLSILISVLLAIIVVFIVFLAQLYSFLICFNVYSTSDGTVNGTASMRY